MTIFAVQYLEYTPDIVTLSTEEACARLEAAFDRLPISIVLIGWNLPLRLLEALANETARHHAMFYRWHPLLTGDGSFIPRREWLTVNLDREPITGLRGLPEFTFVCPNRQEVQETINDHVHEVTRGGLYQGIFLDRIRYPSPSANPISDLTCFCDSCQDAASNDGLDLLKVRNILLTIPKNSQSIKVYLKILLGVNKHPEGEIIAPEQLEAISKYLDFRERSIARFVKNIANIAHSKGLAVGLDCFSPALTRMVGQDLTILDTCCEWIKVILYGHTLGPAGIPYELSNLIRWIKKQNIFQAKEIIEWMSNITGLHLPDTRNDLQTKGLAPEAIVSEYRRAQSIIRKILLPGIELVDIEGVTRLNRNQIMSDLTALHSAGAEGPVLSWDLRHIPYERLELVGKIWG